MNGTTHAHFFAPERIVLGATLNYRRLLLLLLLCCVPVATAPRAVAGMFGISIPANYGRWFTSIYQLYLNNQELIANARKLYTAYLAVSNSIDALEGLGAQDRETFTNRWRRNMRVMLESQIWFELDQHVFEGRDSVNELLQSVLGLTFDEAGRASIDPSRMEMLAIHIAGDRDYWENLFLDAPTPRFPAWFVTDQEFRETTSVYLDRQEEMAFSSFRDHMKEAVAQRILQDVADNPLLYLLCDGKTTCYSPFNFEGENGQVVWRWDQMLENMFATNIPLHDPMPLPGELEAADGVTISDFEQYLHRRVCAAVWRAMGREFKEKLARAHLSLSKRANEINAAVNDINSLVVFLEDLVTPLEDWTPESSGHAAMLVATSLSISADGWAEEQAKQESFLHGVIRKRMDAAINRSMHVQRKLMDVNAVFTNLLDQIAKAEGKRSDHRVIDGYINQNFTATTETLRRNRTPPHSLIGGTQTMQWLAMQILQSTEAGGS
ncbi:hypothetical protein [Acanthopleuribacter pedis]|uniref:Uncharacterized protein n=1 Tax=Acanthopleuribacter pedis TaxID=442870 RepID=A0A8J7QCU5_9BACT|nr:hypothetical protein [Acanthopleuribacter pedis]MBO1323386.1 hypothetical protein [Acanthopleuribacter pedis]